MKENKRFDSYSGMYACVFLSLGIFMPLLGQYLDSVGFSGTEIGVITASGTVVGIFANPWWGLRYERSRDGRRTLILTCLGAALLALLLPALRTYPAFLLGYGVFFLFKSPVNSLLDTMTLESGRAFGSARAWGAVGYAAGCLFAGLLAEALGLPAIFPLFSLAYVTAALIVFYIIKKGAGPGPGRVPSFSAAAPSGAFRARKDQTALKECLHLLKDRRLTALLLSAFFLYGTAVAHNTYFGFLYREGGGTIAGIGLAMLLMAGSEAPVMAWVQGLSARFSLEKVLLAAMCLSALRFLWYGTGPGAGALLATFFLQGLVNGVILVEFLRYLRQLVPAESLPLAVALYTTVSNNCGSIACHAIGGGVLEAFGASGVYLFFGIFNLAGVMIYLLSGLGKRTSGGV